MLNSKKVKILFSLLLIFVVGISLINSSFATDITITGTNTVADSTAAVNNTANNTANTVKSTNTANNTANKTNVDATVGSTNNTANNTTNKVVNNTTNKVVNNSTTSSKLPYTGTNSSIVFVIVALLGSAVYAYKKVADYND